MNYVIELVLLMMWLAGIMLAKGFWSVPSAIIDIPYAWHLKRYLKLMDGCDGPR